MSLAWSTAVRFLTVTAVLVALAAAAVSASAQPPQPTSVPGEALFVISGRGWGHGVGMSQYGAYGMANAGRTYAQILAHYYTGTELGPAPTTDVRVLLAESAPATTIASTVPFTVLDRTGVVHKVPAGPLVLRPKLSLPTRRRSGTGSGPARRSSGEEGAAFARRPRVPGTARDHGQGLVPASRQLRQARGLPPGRHRGRDATPLAARGVEGAGRRSALVRAREPGQGQAVRPLLGRSKSGLSRGRGRDCENLRSRARDERRGRPLRRQGRDDLLLLDVGREDRERRRRLRNARAVPPVPPGPVRRGFATSPLGARAARRPHPAVEAGARRPSPGRRRRPHGFGSPALTHACRPTRARRR